MGNKDKKPGKNLSSRQPSIRQFHPECKRRGQGQRRRPPGVDAPEGDVFLHVSAHGLRLIGPSGIAEGFVGARSRMVFVEGPENHQEDDRPPSQEEPAIGAFAGGS